MLEHSGNLFKQRAARLGLERGDMLTKIQNRLDVLYPGQTRAISLNAGILKLITPNSSVASDVRMRQSELLREFGKVQRVVISIRTLKD